MSGRLSAILSGIAFALLAILLLIMNKGPSASNAVVIMWLALFISATLCAISGIVLGVLGLRKPGKLPAVIGLIVGLFFLITASILLAMLIEFIKSVGD
jgi:hypothetical protein